MNLAEESLQGVCQHIWPKVDSELPHLCTNCGIDRDIVSNDFTEFNEYLYKLDPQFKIKDLQWKLRWRALEYNIFRWKQNLD